MLITYSSAVPAIHAFICGISDYTHLPADAPTPDKWNLRKLQSASTGALRFFEWLQGAGTTLPLPLGTVELILAPSPIELQAEPDLAQCAQPAEADADAFTEAVARWRDRLQDQEDSIAVFYFAGHGIQRDRGSAIILLRNVMEQPHARLSNAVNFSDIHDGLAPGGNMENIAKRQFFFLDTCRVVPEDIGDYDRIATRPLFDTHRAGRDVRQAAPVYFASLYDSKDYALPAQGSLFNRLLLRSLRSGADVSRGTSSSPRWPVTVQSLAHALWTEFLRHGSQQVFSMGGHTTSDPEICTLDSAPELRLSIDLQPRANQQNVASIVLKQGNGRSRQLTPPLIPLPHSIAWPAGVTTVEVWVDRNAPSSVVGPVFINHRNSNMTVSI